MNKQDLETMLMELDTALVKAFKKEREPMQVLVVGGACLLLLDVIERQTQDIDVIIFDLMGSEEESSLIFDAPLANKIRKIIKRVAKAHGLGHMLFLNDDCAPFLLELSENTLPPMRLLRAYQKLHLYVPADLSYILACKLMAGRPAKDYGDIQALCQQLSIHSRHQAQRIVSAYFPSHQQQIIHQLPKTLGDLFPA